MADRMAMVHSRTARFLCTRLTRPTQDGDQHQYYRQQSSCVHPDRYLNRSSLYSYLRTMAHRRNQNDAASVPNGR